MVWITQWLCTNRHCSIAIPWDDQEMTSDQVEEKGEGIYRRGVIHRWCGICGGELHVEHGRTRFKTMDEALPKINATAEANLLARNIFGGRF
jgi:hypothetical protein